MNKDMVVGIILGVVVASGIAANTFFIIDLEGKSAALQQGQVQIVQGVQKAFGQLQSTRPLNSQPASVQGVPSK